MSIEQIISSKQRINAIFDAAEILTRARLEAIHMPTEGWNILYKAQHHLMDQLESRKAA